MGWNDAQTFWTTDDPNDNMSDEMWEDYISQYK